MTPSSELTNPTGPFVPHDTSYTSVNVWGATTPKSPPNSGVEFP